VRQRHGDDVRGDGERRRERRRAHALRLPAPQRERAEPDGAAYLECLEVRARR